MEEIEKSDAQLWVFLARFHSIKSHNEWPVKDSFYEQDPATLSEGYLINSSIYLDGLKERLFESRMYKQKGRFFLSSRDNFGVPMNRQKEIAPLLFRFKIPSSIKATIRAELMERGITREYLYVEENTAHQAVVNSINQKIFTIK